MSYPNVDQIVHEIEADILDRRGLKSELRQCDPEVREKIRNAWREIIRGELARAGVL